MSSDRRQPCPVEPWPTLILLGVQVQKSGCIFAPTFPRVSSQVQLMAILAGVNAP